MSLADWLGNPNGLFGQGLRMPPGRVVQRRRHDINKETLDGSLPWGGPHPHRQRPQVDLLHASEAHTLSNHLDSGSC
jgi:hypothetical protein